LIVDDSVLDDIVRRCLKKETGARGLKSIISEYLEDACFDAYSSPGRCSEIRVTFNGQKIETKIK
jgi:ATP-dependent protease Clp ATPase subunit